MDDPEEVLWVRFFEQVQGLLNYYEAVFLANNHFEMVEMGEIMGRHIHTLAYILDMVPDDIPEDLQNDLHTVRMLHEALLVLESNINSQIGNRPCTDVGLLSYVGEYEFSDGPGKPRFKVDMEQVHYLHNLGFTLTNISAMLNISRTTLWRRLLEDPVGMNRFTDITDGNLRIVIQEIYDRHVHCGVVMMMGHLRSQGVIVQRQRVRNIMQEIDPANCALRWSMRIRRRVYSVPTANYLWHLDTHHALIRWRLVTAGCIDGYSRLVVFLAISDNNRADTVLNLFQNAVARYGCPSRVSIINNSPTHANKEVNSLLDANNYTMICTFIVGFYAICQ